MTDIRLRQTVTDNAPQVVTLNWLLTPVGALDTDQELATAVIVALGTDRLANPDDELPNPADNDRRGWWGDYQAEQLHDGWPIGSRLWLLSRSAITSGASRHGSTVARAREYAREALDPFIDRAIASRVDVQAERSGTERIDITATLYRGPSPSISVRFSSLWDGIIA